MTEISLNINSPIVSVEARSNSGSVVSIAVPSTALVSVTVTGARGPQGTAGADGATDIEVGDLAALFESF